ncbi:MAG: filamentous hemagglutinin N-terminal domain-containing protein, partial [Verrucomicrobia bacterium]|nr:filamentous hemagglutinin N-terminal domain-containing protein [Verrucomicrobiota bacterium]
MKTPRRRFPLSRAVLLTAAFLVPSAFAQTAPATNALPSGGQVAAGQVSMATTGAPGSPTLQVTQGSDRAIVNWQAFDVGRDATVRFDQPSASSAILNRVVGTDASRIFGRVEANGQVFLVNPQGVYFGPSSSVDVGSFVASTLSIRDADFLAGRLNFSRDGATGSVVNEGTIRSALGGYVALLAPEVRNAGVILAQAGTVVLAAGEAVSFNFDPAAGVTGLLVEPATVRALVENRRIVAAPGGQVIVSAQAHNALAAGVIRNTGEIAATGIAQDGGRIYLGASDTVEQGGLVDASAAAGKGGDITVVAPTIALLDSSSLLAEGELGGGRVRVGGEWQGGGTLPQSRLVTMDATALIDASARRLGAGGEVVLWSDVRDAASLTQAAGRILARGGRLGGDGGRVETSGRVLDVPSLSVDTRAPAGRTGDWLLDPVNITIADSGGNLTPAQLRAGLLTSNVSISTAGSGSASGVSPTYSAGAGDITISSVIESLSPNSLTLTADNNINVSAVVRMAGALTLNAGNLINLGANVTTGGDQTYNGAVNLTSAVTLSSYGWDVSNYQWLASQGELTARFGGSSVMFRVVGGTGGQGGTDTLVGLAGGASGDYTATVALSGATDAVIQAGTGGGGGANQASNSGGGAGGTGRAGYQGGAGGAAGSAGSSGGGGGGGAASVVAILGGTLVGGGGGGGAGANNVAGNPGTAGQGATSQVASGNAGGTGGFGGNPLPDGGGSGGGGGGILGGQGGVGVNASTETSGRGGFAGTSGASGVTVTGASTTTYAAPSPNAAGATPAAGHNGFIAITGRLVASATPGNVIFNSTVNGAQALTVYAGTGTVTFGGNVGATTPIGALLVEAAGTSFGTGAGSRSVLTGGSQTWSTPLALDSRSLVLETRGAAGSSFVIDLNQGITKAAGGDITVDLRAHRDIFLGGAFIPAAGKVDLKFEADYENNGSAVSRDGVGFIQVNGSLATNGGYLKFGSGVSATVNGVSTLVGGDVYVTGASLTTFNTGGGAFEAQGELLIGNASGLSVLTGGGSALFAGAVDAGNTYASVVTNVTWDTARTNAASGTQGAVGSTYLATITSRLENMIAIRAANYDTAWLGGRRVVGIGTNQAWRWVTGPEGLLDSGNGLRFFTQNYTYAANVPQGTAISGAYTNWNTNEPNNSGGTNTDSASEPMLQFVGVSGVWNDLSSTSTTPNRYVRETLLASAPLTVDAGAGAVTFSAALGQKKALGNTAVTGGVVSFSGAASVGTNVLTVTAGTSATGTAGALTASSLVLQGAGAHTFTNAANNITTLAGGTLAQPVGAVSFRDADALTVGTVGSVVGLRSGGAVSLTSSANVEVSSALFNGAGGVTVSAAGLAGGGTITVPSGATFALTQSGTSVFTGAIAGDGAFSKAGAGVLSLTGASTFTGGTTLTAGTLGVYHASSLGTGTLSVGGATVRFGRALATLANDITLTGATTFVFDTSVDYLLVGGGGGGGAHVGGGGGGGGVLTGTTALTATTSAVSVGAGGTGSTNINVSVRTAATAGGNTTAFGLTAFGGGAGGNWNTIAATAGGSGGGQGANLTAAAGTTGQGFAGGIGDGVSTYGYVAGGGGGAGGVGGTASTTQAGNGGIGLVSAITGTDAYYGGGGGGGVHTANLAAAGFGGLGGGGNGAVNLQGARAPDGVANTGGGGGGNGAVSNAVTIGGNGGSGVLIVSYLGPSAGTSGTVSTGTAGAVGRTLHTFTSTGAGSLVLSALSTSLSGTISGAGALTVNATGGTVTFTGANTSTGTTTISGGTLRVGAGGAAGVLGAGAITNNAALVFNRSSTYAVANDVSGTGTVEQLGPGTTVITGALTHTGGTTVTAGTLRVGAGGTAGSLAGNVVTQGVLAFDRSDALTFAGNISGAGAVTQVGTNILTLTGAATYSGVTNVDAGSILFRRDVPPATSGFAGVGAVTIEPASAGFASAVTTAYTYASTLTGLTLGKAGNSAAVTIGSAISIAGPIRLFGGDVTVSANVTSNGADQPIVFQAVSNVLLSASRTIQTNGGDIVFWSNSGAAASGNRGILISDSSVLDSRTAADRAATTHTTGGGMIVLGGGNTTETSAKGTTVPTGYALNYTSTPAGLMIGSYNSGVGHNANVRMFSGGGNVVWRGRSTQNVVNLTIGISAFEGVTVNAGTTGDITIDGEAVGNTIAAGMDIHGWRTGVASSSYLTVDGDILFTGSGTGATTNLGTQLGSSAGFPVILAATGNGSVTVKGVTSGTFS